MAEADPSAPAATCAFCFTSLDGTIDIVACPSCRTGYHPECWQENGGCAVYGCTRMPVVDARQAIEIPHSYWGSENKPCPVCGEQILAAALRCRKCGATFSSAQPEAAGDFQRRARQEERLPGVRRMALLVFFLCIIPLLAPVGALVGLIWYFRNREDIRALPQVYGVMTRLGLVVAVVLTVAGTALSALYAVVRTG